MIRIRSQRLLSGVSTFAVLAALGVANPAIAGQNIDGTTNPNAPVTNALANSDDFIDINTGAVVTANGDGRSLINLGTLTSYVAITASQLQGDVYNSGTITGLNQNAISIFNSVIDGKIVNTGSITGSTSGAGISVSGASLFEGITNSGSIIGNASTAYGVTLANGVVVNGDITNASTGTITANGGTSAIALRLRMAQLNGKVENSGSIVANGNVARGITLESGIVTGSIVNNSSGAITANGTTAGTGVRVSGGALQGNISNAGTISAFGNTAVGVRLSGGVVQGSILNTTTGTIGGEGGEFGYGIRVVGGSLVGDIRNEGSIIGDGLTAAGILMSSGTVSGKIINTSTGTISGIGASAAGIRLTGGTLGGIDNSGLIVAPDYGIRVNGGTVSGAILNQSTGVINATAALGYGLSLESGSVGGGIENRGTIRANAANGRGLNMSGGSLLGGIKNSGTIEATGLGGNAIDISDGTMTGTLHNTATGLIRAQGDAIDISDATFVNDIINDGEIASVNGDGILITSATLFGGDITNNGNIGNSTTRVGSDGINLSAPDVIGSITNGEGAEIYANGMGIRLTSTNFTGDLTNDGVIDGGENGVVISGVNFDGSILNGETGSIVGNTAGFGIANSTVTGDITNDGSITGSTDGLIITNSTIGDISNSGTIISNTTNGGAGLHLDNSTVASITNDGTLSGEGDAVLLVDSTITGDFTNSNEVIGDDNNGGVGIGVVIQDSNIGGIFGNSGTISGGTAAIRVTGNSTITGGIENSGTIEGGEFGIDISGATAVGGYTITQTDGSIEGGEYAMRLNNGLADTFNGNGGLLIGSINVNATDVFNMAPGAGGQFAWVDGGTTGTLASFNKSGAGTALLGAEERGETNTNFVNAVAATMAHSAGRLYLDDQATINLTGNYTQSAGAVTEFFLTTNTGVHGLIAAGGTATMNGTIEAFLDPVTFATAALLPTTVLTYQDVVTGTIGGSLVNGSTIVTSSPFFVGKVVRNPGDIDITIQRLAFNSVLLVNTANQAAVGGALEEIYLGTPSADLTDVLEGLFGASTAAEARAILDELSGSQHAQTQQTTLSIGNVFTNLVDERLDGILLSQDGSRMNAALAKQERYAQALGLTATDAMSAAAGGSPGLTRGPGGMSVWLRVQGNWVNVDQDPEATGYQQDTNGLVGGVDFALNPNATIGGAVAYSQTDVDYDTAPDKGEIDSWQVGAYGSYGFGRFYLDGQASYASHDINSSRRVDVGPPAGTVVAGADYSADAWAIKGELGTIWRLGRVNMQPSAALAYTNASSDGFIETSSGADGFLLNVAGSDSTSLASTVALRASGQWMMAKTPIVPDLKIGWRHEFDDNRQSFTATFIDATAVPFTIVSSEIQPDSLVVSTGFTAGVNKNFEVFFDINGQYNADMSATNASGGLRFTW